MDEAKFVEEVLEWYKFEGRDFYWRAHELEPFEVLVLEMFLKRTRAKTVDGLAEELLDRLSSPRRVMNMDQEEIIDIIEPLGLYNRRSKNLKNVCKELEEEYEGNVPDRRKDLLEVNGVGEYIADAVLCFAYRRPVLVLDSNVAQVASQYFNLEIPADLRQDDAIRDTLEPLVPPDVPREFNWGLIDLGAALKNTQNSDNLYFGRV